MGTCLSKKKGSSTTSSLVAETKCFSTSAHAELKKNSENAITVFKPKVETDPEEDILKKEKKTVQEKQEQPQEDGGGQLKKEIFIIKHRKSHDDRERNPKCPQPVRQNAPPEPVLHGFTSNEANNNEVAELVGTGKIVPAAATMGVGVRTSSCTKEEVDAILIQCGRLSRSSSGKAASSSTAAGERRRRYSGSKRSYDFDQCDNDTISADDDQKRANGTDNSSDLCEDDGEKRHHQHRPRSRQSPRRPSSSQGRRRTPSRERDQQHQHQRSSSRERRVSRSPGRRSSETSNPTSTNPASAIASNNNSNSTARPGKMVSVPPTVSSLAMDKSNNGGGGGGESAATTGIKRISAKRNVGDSGMASSRSAASPRSQSPARANGNGNAANCKAFGENHQQQPSLSRSSSRKADQSPYRRNPLSEIDPNALAYPQSANNKKPNVDVNDTKNRTRGVTVICKPKEQQEEEVRGHSSMIEHVVVKTVVPSGVDNLKPPQTLTRSRSSRRSRDLDLNPEALLNPEQSYTSLLLEDIHNFHQKNTTSTPSVPLPACVTKACSILEAVADLNSTTSSNLSGPFVEDLKSPPTYESTSNEYNNGSLGANHYGKKRVTNSKDPFVESEVVVHDDVMEPSFHKYVTVKRGASVGGGGVDMEDQESSGSNSFTVGGQQNWGFSPSWEPNSADSTDCWTSRLNPREEVQKSPLGLDGSLASEAGRDIDEARKKSNGKRRECDHQHSSGIGRGRLGANRGLHTIPVTAAAST